MLSRLGYSPKKSFNKDLTQSVLKGIAFPVFNYWFALPIEAVLKIIACPPLDSEIQEGLGLAEWDRQTITIIDLRQKLEPLKIELPKNKKRSHHSLILIQTNDAELCGFLAEEYPILIDIPVDSICSIPNSYRQVAKLGVINKMAILSQPELEKNLKLFLLGEWKHTLIS